MNLTLYKTPNGRPCFARDENFELFLKSCEILGLDYKMELGKILKETFGKEILSFAVEIKEEQGGEKNE